MLLRHAKAGRGEPDDHKRALIERGRSDAARIGRFMHDDVYLPDVVLCSTSVRTKDTVKHLLPALGFKPAVHYLSELYLAEPELIVSLVRRTPDEAGSLMIVGHNPGIAECAVRLARVPADRKVRKRYDAMEEKFSTGALAVIDFEVRKWSDVAPGEGELDAFVRPKDLDSSKT